MWWPLVTNIPTPRPSQRPQTITEVYGCGRVKGRESTWISDFLDEDEDDDEDVGEGPEEDEEDSDDGNE